MTATGALNHSAEFMVAAYLYHSDRFNAPARGIFCILSSLVSPAQAGPGLYSWNRVRKISHIVRVTSKYGYCVLG